MSYQQIKIVRHASRRWLGWGVLVSLLLIAALAAPLALAAPAPQVGGTLRIGLLGAQSSDLANGAQLAIDQINGAGGVTGPDGASYTLELVFPTGPFPTADTLADDVADLVAQNVAAIIGPDNNVVLTTDNIDVLIKPGIPVLIGATSDSLTDSDLSNTLFRIRAPEAVYSNALATYLVDDLGFTSIALVQTDVDATEALVDFKNTLQTAGIVPGESIQLPSGAELLNQTSRLINLNPEAIVMWGAAKDAVSLLRELRNNGWAGRFAYRNADEAARAGVLPYDLGEGMLGASSWVYSYGGRATRIFLLEYVLAFGSVPGPAAAASYDAVWYLRSVVSNVGDEPAAIREGLINGPSLNLVQGPIHPGDFGNGDLSHVGVVYEIGAYGGASVLARFDGTQRLPVEEGGAVAQVPTPTPAQPLATPFPTATLEGTWAIVTANVLNVRTGPGFNYDKVGQVEAGDQLRILSAIPDYSWLTVQFQGGVGWIKTEYVDIAGNIADVPVVQAPVSPTPAATLTPSLEPIPNLLIDSVVLNPPQPVPNQPFTATVTVRNAGGGAAGQFAVAGTFEPGGVYLSAIVPGLAGGQTTQVQLSGTLNGTGVFQVAIVVDLNNEVAESNEDDNMYNITYRVDYAVLSSQSGLQLNSGTSWDMDNDGAPDFSWDGYNLAMQNGSSMGLLGGVTFENVTYDQLSPSVITNTTGVGTDKVNPGVIIGMYTSSGKRAVMRIDNRQGETIWISYRVYAP